MKTSGALRGALKEQRCLVPNHGFFEWQRDGKTKFPYWFKPADTEIPFSPASGIAGTASTKVSQPPSSPFAILT